MKITGYKHPPGTGRRQIDLRIEDESLAVGWLEDDFHHFGVSIRFGDGKVEDIRMAAPRTPWNTCAGAAEPLRTLVGQPLITRASDIGKLIDMRLQCTHVFDLTGLLLAHIGNRHQRLAHRRYHSQVPDRPIQGSEFELASYGAGEAWLYQDGERVMYWQVDGDRITAPPAFAGVSLSTGFRPWTEQLPEQEAEYATILRRAMELSSARSIDSDDYPTAADMTMKPLCHTFQQHRAPRARRNFGNALDYSEHPEQMLLNVSEIP
ncbi:MAG: hypothetical protein ACK5HY_07250 [Parahaliea sp.]